MKNIRLTSQTEKKYKIKRDHATEGLINLGYMLDGARGARYAAKTVQNRNLMKLETVLITHNTVLITSNTKKDIMINTIGFKSTKKIPFPKKLDSLIYILEHFFHKIKREEFKL